MSRLFFLGNAKGVIEKIASAIFFQTGKSSGGAGTLPAGSGGEKVNRKKK